MFNSFISGGQVFLHKVRMFGQVLGRTVHLSILVGVFVGIAVQWNSLKGAPWDGFVSYRKATLAIGFDEAMNQIRYMIGKKTNHTTLIDAKLGTKEWKRVDPSFVSKMYIFKNSDEKVMTLLVSVLIWCVSVSLLCILGIFLIWSKFGKHLKDDSISADSGKVLSANEVRNILNSLGLASILKIGTMPLVKDSETKHFLVTGATGSGKTTFMDNLLPQVQEKGHPAIVIDQTGEMISKYYQPDRGDIIFNPLDSRSMTWNIWKDCLGEEDKVAKIIIEFNSKSSGSRANPFWDLSAAEILAALLKICQPIKSFEELNRLARNSTVGELTYRLKGHAAARYFNQDNSVTASSILSVLTTNSKPLSYLKDGNPNGTFSLKEYFEQIKQGRNNWLFLATKPSNRQITLPLIASMVELACSEMMNIGIDQNRRLWFVLDELAALGNLPALSSLMAEGRKYGACVMAGLQSLSQLNESYGSYGTSKLFGQFGTLCFFRNREESIARMFTHMCGKEIRIHQQKNTSFGAHEFRDGLSFTEQEKHKDLVTYRDIASLGVGECYMLLPEPKVYLAKVQTPEASIPEKQEGFISADTIFDTDTRDIEWSEDEDTMIGTDNPYEEESDTKEQDLETLTKQKQSILI